jgi:spermidine synthase
MKQKNNSIAKYLLEIIVFTTGAVVMIFELTGSRLLGPYIGTSIFVWTSLIGVILGSLSVGYYYGGKLADRHASVVKLSFIIFIAGVFVGLTVIVNKTVLSTLSKLITDIRISSIIASILLFSPASFFLGMVSPYAVKLKLKNIKTSGSTIGNMYAISTIGSIIGTFVAGFFLIPSIGTTNILFLLSGILVILSFLTHTSQLMKVKSVFLAIIFFLFAIENALNYAYTEDGYIDTDTQYNRVRIYSTKDAKTDKEIKMMRINNESSSAMYLDSSELVFQYTKFYHLLRHFNPQFQKTLMIGGGAYSFPKDYVHKYPDKQIDVVEIDPQLTALARKYFHLKDSPHLKIIHDDGRIFLNKTKEKYDVVLIDAFKSFYSIPYQLTTQETAEQIYNILNENGVVMINVISAIEGAKGTFLQAEYATYKSVFPYAYVIPVNSTNAKKPQNIMLIAVKSANTPLLSSEDKELDKYLENVWTEEIKTSVPILTDDYAPVDYYIGKMLE